MGESVNPQWRNEKFAKPIFASIELQRQQLLSGNNWSDWQVVPKTKICHLAETLKVPDDVSLLPYGIERLLIVFDSGTMQKEILQPAVYDDALAAGAWLPPVVFQQQEEAIRKKQQEEARGQREEKIRQRQKEKKLLRASESRSATTRAGRDQPQGAPDMMPLGGGGMPRGDMMTQPTRLRPGAVDRRPVKPATGGRTGNVGWGAGRPSINTAGEDGEQSFRIEEDTDLSALKELLFWAHDDTTEPGNKYRYRIRIGVFNPLAGKNWFSRAQSNLRNQTVLWSGFSEATETVDISPRLAIFPKDVRESDKTVTVQISKYQLGQWHSSDFRVKPGEVIGKKLSAPKRTSLATAKDETEFLDYTTDAVLIDIARVSNWIGAGALSSRSYYDMLYTLDGETIERLAARDRYWPAELNEKFKEIKENQEQGPPTLSPRSQNTRRTTQPRRGFGIPEGAVMPDMGGMEEMRRLQGPMPGR